MCKILGVNKRCYPTQCGWPGTDSNAESIRGQSMDPPEIVAVMVAGEIGDYACYIGLGSPDWVARLGDKLVFEEARCHFPFIVKEKYRSR